MNTSRRDPPHLPLLPQHLLFFLLPSLSSPCPHLTSKAICHFPNRSFSTRTEQNPPLPTAQPRRPQNPRQRPDARGSRAARICRSRGKRIPPRRGRDASGRLPTGSATRKGRRKRAGKRAEKARKVQEAAAKRAARETRRARKEEEAAAQRAAREASKARRQAEGAAKMLAREQKKEERRESKRQAETARQEQHQRARAQAAGRAARDNVARLHRPWGL